MTFTVPDPLNFPNATYSPNTIGQFLAAGGATGITYTGASSGSSLDNSLFDFKGFVSVTTGQTFTVSHDDGATLVINGQTVISATTPTSFIASTGTYTGPSGTFAYELVYGEATGLAGLTASLPIANTVW